MTLRPILRLDIYIGKLGFNKRLDVTEFLSVKETTSSNNHPF